MARCLVNPFVWLGFGIAAASLPGCSSWDLSSVSLWPFDRNKDAGVVTPADRMAKLREMAARAPSSSPAQREQMAQDLARAIDQDPDPMIRAEMVRALAACKTPTADGVLYRALKDDGADVRIAACEVLGKRGGRDAIAALSETLGSEVNLDVRLAAARALGQTGDPSAISPLGLALSDDDPAMQYQGVESLRHLTGEDFGGDVTRWQQYARGEPVRKEEPVSLAERLEQLRLF